MFIPVRWIKQNVALQFNLQTNKMTNKMTLKAIYV